MSEILKEAKRLYDLGFAIQWLRPKSKIPIDPKWTDGSRKSWEELERQYQSGFNLSTRLGTPAKLAHGYLAVIDVDVKSDLPHHRGAAHDAAAALYGGRLCPSVLSGRGNGSAHFYCVTEKPFKTFNAAWSEEQVKFHSPSKPISKRERQTLSKDELAKGLRLGRAWEISCYSDGRQVVLPPSVHPDSGKFYAWDQSVYSVKSFPLLDLAAPAPKDALQHTINMVREDFKVEPVDLGWLPISEDVRRGIQTCEGVVDRSGFMLLAATALASAGLSQNEILSVLTDPTNALSECAYEHAKTSSRARAAEWVSRYTLKKVVAERETVREFAKTIGESRKLTEAEMDETAREFAEQRDWRQDLKKTQQGQIQKTLNNTMLIMEKMGGEGVIRRDCFAYRDTYTADTPWRGKKGESVGDDDIPEIQSWISREFGFQPNRNDIEGALVVMARKNGYDPVKNWLDNLPAWDEVKRLDSWLAKNFEAKGDPEYLAQVFRKWMVAMVMRIYEPGAKFDWMPIFEGVQGAGKSSFGRLLVGDNYFLDWLPNLADKDASLGLQGMWGVELGELSQFRQSQLEQIKSFITRTVDKMRPPYGKRPIESPRRCVFFGTTNRDRYLVDETGNRRFKPVMVGSLNFDALKRDRIQLFAEARHLWMNKIERVETLYLESNARIYEQQIHEEKMVLDESDAMKEYMENFLQKVHTKEINFKLDGFHLVELFSSDRAPLIRWTPTMRSQRSCGKMLRKLGFEKFPSNGRMLWRKKA